MWSLRVSEVVDERVDRQRVSQNERDEKKSVKRFIFVSVGRVFYYRVLICRRHVVGIYKKNSSVFFAGC